MVSASDLAKRALVSVLRNLFSLYSVAISISRDSPDSEVRTAPAGPRRILCDNESFIKSKESKKFYKKNNIELLCIPPRSPDLNPIEMYWAWLRKALRRQELSDLRAKKPALGKTAYRARIKAFLKTKKAQTVAKAIFGSLRGKCKEVIRKKGAAIRS